MRFIHHKEPLLTRARKIAAERKIELSTQLVIAHRASDGILTAIEQHQAEALIMGWKGYTNAKDRIFGEIADRIIRFATCDLMVLKIGDNRNMRHCLLPTAGGPNAKLAASILGAISKETKMSITAGYVIPENASQKQKEEGMLLLLDNGMFYEFIPADEFYNENPRRLTIGEVELGVNYVLILNTNSGLWGYNIGDTIVFTSKKPYRIKP
jgi:hypothetical protein